MKFAEFAQRSVTPAAPNVQIMTMNTAENVPKPVKTVLINAERWRHNAEKWISGTGKKREDQISG